MDINQHENIKQQIESIINSLNQLLENEEFPAYMNLLNSYTKALNALTKKQSLKCIKKEVKWNCRILGEAPPKNRELGILLMTKMDKFHKTISNTIDPKE